MKNFRNWRICDTQGEELFIFSSPESDAVALERVVEKSFPGGYLEEV